MKKLLVLLCVVSCLYGGSRSSLGSGSPRVQVKIIINTTAEDVVKALVGKKTFDEGVQALEQYDKQLTDDMVREIIVLAGKSEKLMFIIKPVVWYLMEKNRIAVLAPEYRVGTVEGAYVYNVKYAPDVPENMRPLIERAMKSFFDDRFEHVSKS